MATAALVRSQEQGWAQSDCEGVELAYRVQTVLLISYKPSIRSELAGGFRDNSIEQLIALKFPQI